MTTTKKDRLTQLVTPVLDQTTRTDDDSLLHSRPSSDGRLEKEGVKESNALKRLSCFDEEERSAERSAKRYRRYGRGVQVEAETYRDPSRRP